MFTVLALVLSTARMLSVPFITVTNPEHAVFILCHMQLAFDGTVILTD